MLLSNLAASQRDCAQRFWPHERAAGIRDLVGFSQPSKDRGSSPSGGPFAREQAPPAGGAHSLAVTRTACTTQIRRER